MIFVGIDVAKGKHDCCILSSSGEILRDSFSFNNSHHGFEFFWSELKTVCQAQDCPQIKAGLEATGHYSENLVAFLRTRGIEPVVFNPLRVKLFRTSLSLRKTKTDKVDARCIAGLLMSDDSSPVPVSYQIQELKSLTRHRSRLVALRSRSKVSLCRVIDVLFPELASTCSSISQPSMLALLKELPGAHHIARCRIDRLTNLLCTHSRGKYGREKATEIKHLAIQSIGRESYALSFELIQVIEEIQFYYRQIHLLDQKIQVLILATETPLLTIPGIGFRLAAIILSEIGDIHRFRSSDQLLAFAGLEPSTNQSGNYQANRTPMVKRGSTYLRWALMQAARLSSIYCLDFRQYKDRKIAQGKHYFVALGHLSKKLVRVIFHMLTLNEPFVSQVSA